MNGQAGRAQKLIGTLQTGDWPAASAEFYNSLEAPALEKFPMLPLFQEFLRDNGALAALMSGSGSTTFAIVENADAGECARGKIQGTFRRELLDGGGAGLIVGGTPCRRPK